MIARCPNGHSSKRLNKIVPTRRNEPQKADPPAPNALLSETVMWMHESPVAPSYSADMLEAGSTINADHPAGNV
jgi:hypothetical protein